MQCIYNKNLGIALAVGNEEGNNLNSGFVCKIINKAFKPSALHKSGRKDGQNSGFTLAEVLIAMTVIGIIAAMTIPTLVSNYQKEEYVVGLKKAYSIATQALLQMSDDAGCSGDLRCMNLFGGTNEDIGDKLVDYFSVDKNCGVEMSNNDALRECFRSVIHTDYDSAPNVTANFANWYNFITADGVAYSIVGSGALLGGNCPDDTWTGVGPLTQHCGNLLIDVNGPLKKPNTFGRDIFGFNITSGEGIKLYPFGAEQTILTPYWKDACNTDVKNGMSCTARVMDESWQMKY